MDDLDDVIGLLNSNKGQKAKAAFMPAPQIGTSNQPVSVEEVSEIADRKLNIEKMMEELDALKVKK